MIVRGFSLICVALLLLSACGEEAEIYETTQASLSSVSDEDGRELRSVLHKFDGGGLHGVNVTSIVDVILNECLRKFAGAYGGQQILVSGGALDLTDSGVLPKNDGFGNYDPSGGFLEYVEATPASLSGKGKETKTHKLAREFKAGAIEGFAFAHTKDSPDGYSLHHRLQNSFSVASDVEYEQTAWHQVASYTQKGDTLSDPGYTYNSHPTMVITLSQGDRAMNLTAVDDLIESGQGWSETVINQSDMVLTGNLTLYRPKTTNVKANTNAEQELEESKDVEDGLEVTVTTRTTVSELTSPASDPVLNQTVREVRTDTTTTKTEPTTAVDTGREVFSETEEYITSNVSYSVASGQGATALTNHNLEKFQDHVVTEKTIVTVTTEFEGDGVGDYERTTVTTAYRHTDNPSTRNDIAQWMSTRSSVVHTVDAGAEINSVRFGGTEWLTNQIEVDPEFDNIPFTWNGGTKVVTLSEGHYFGADSSAFESSEDTETEISISAGFGSSAVMVSGGYAQRSASISNGSGDDHSVEGDEDGTLSVTVGESSHTVSAEEWIGWLAPKSP